ncbi:MAG: hypothetical protein FWF53_03065 [Candidatus Azobacteroides sp.]|nr:hypothetical protein [Candidatus Azobacteroides sp.]
MYQFRTLKSLYSVIIAYRLPDYTEQKYRCKIVVKAKREKENYLFTLEERLDVRLNNEKPQKVVDNLMTQLGNCLYPIELHVSATGELLSIPNFGQIRGRWLETARELLKRNRTQEFKNYLEAAKTNLFDERRFLKSLAKDTFIQMYFKDYPANKAELEFVNFPYQNKKTSFYARKIPTASRAYALLPTFREPKVQETEGKLVLWKNNECGEPFKIKANIRLLTSESELYQKDILIEADENEHKVKTGLFF